MMYAVNKNKLRIVRDIGLGMLEEFKSNTVDINLDMFFESLEQVMLYEFVDAEDCVLVIGDKNTAALISYKNSKVEMLAKVSLRTLNIMNIYNVEALDCSLKLSHSNSSYACLSLYDKTTNLSELDLFLISEDDDGKLKIELVDSCQPPSSITPFPFPNCENIMGLAFATIPGYEHAPYLIGASVNSSTIHAYLVDPYTHKLVYNQELRSKVSFGMVNEIVPQIATHINHEKDGIEETVLKLWIYGN